MKSTTVLTHIQQENLLSRKINELPLHIRGTHLQELIFQLYKELQKAGILFKPKAYLSDGWGCPDRVPVIGIPFYLADPALSKLQAQMTGEKIADDETFMMLLRHEAGHTFNYVYRLYEKPKWQKIFGLFSLPYLDDYKDKVDPCSTRFVHHIGGCYAQKHPDDDFAETFAVWLTPGSDWQKVYSGTPAIEKLQFVDRTASVYEGKSPLVTGGRLDMPLGEMEMTLGEWYQMVYKKSHKKAASRSAARK
jgi:hypothetical protein